MGEFSFFMFDARLGIHVPHITKDWEQYSMPDREAVVTQWEQIRGSIPEKIKEFEAIINAKQLLMNEAEDFVNCCRLNAEIAEMASRINDLHLWFRANQDVSDTKAHT